MDGQMRWSSLGIQAGEAGSASGILGIWTGIDHEPQDPAGASLTAFTNTIPLSVGILINGVGVFQVRSGSGR